MDPGREMSLGLDRAGWFSAHHGSIARHDRPAERKHTQHLSDVICSNAPSKSRPVGSFVETSSPENGYASGASNVSSASVSIIGNSQRGSKRRE